MDSLQNDDELLLMELERRDGIYSFIFHELENNTEVELKKENQFDLKATKQIKTEILTNKNEPKTYHPTNTIEISLKSEMSSLLPNPANFSGFNQTKSSKASSQDSFSLTKVCISRQNTKPESSLNFIQQMSSIQQLCSLRALNVRRAKSPFSYLHEPMVRNRRHKLKETKEYKNFMQNITKVADLRELFPMDPDVHAPFLVKEKNL